MGGLFARRLLKTQPIIEDLKKTPEKKGERWIWLKNNYDIAHL